QQADGGRLAVRPPQAGGGEVRSVVEQLDGTPYPDHDLRGDGGVPVDHPGHRLEADSREGPDVQHGRRLSRRKLAARQRFLLLHLLLFQDRMDREQIVTLDKTWTTREACVRVRNNVVSHATRARWQRRGEE